MESQKFKSLQKCTDIADCPDDVSDSDKCDVQLGYDNDLFFGDHETQLSEGGEGDLSRHLASCKKNPGHTKFIPVETFSFEDLPQTYHDRDLFELITATAELTVKVSVEMTSPQRPEFWPNLDVPYPFYCKRGSTSLRSGSGRVESVRFVSGEHDDQQNEDSTTQCVCQECQHSDSPQKACWEIVIMSAAHVVFDDVEASHASVRLFYDRSDSPEVVLKAVGVVKVSVEEDRCLFKCVTCDKELGQRLETMLKNWGSLWFNIDDKYRASKDVHKLSFIVSHPHGCPKMVSLGQWKDKYQVGKNALINKFTYTTGTCPGSSGAQVYFVGYIGGWKEHVHSGTVCQDELNFSGIGSVF